MTEEADHVSPADEPTSESPKPSQEVARDEMLATLGAASSHPEFALTRLRNWRLITLLPVLAAFAVLAWHIWNIVGDITSFQIQSLIVNIGKVVVELFRIPEKVVIGASACIAALLTATLTIRASVIQRCAARPGLAPATSWRMFWVFSLLAVLGCTALAWLSSSTLIGIEYRRWIIAGALAPLYVLTVLFEWEAHQQDEEQSGFSRLKMVFWALATPVALASMAVTYNAFWEGLSNQIFKAMFFVVNFFGWKQVGELLNSMVVQKVHSGVFGFATMIFALIFLFVIHMRVSGVFAEAMKNVERRREKFDRKWQQPEAQEPEVVPWYIKIVRWILGMFGPAHDEPPAANSSSSDDSILESVWRPFVEALEQSSGAPAGKFDVQVEGETVSIPMDEESPYEVEIQTVSEYPAETDASSTSPDAENEEFSWLFGDRRPSTDQVHLLQEFQNRWVEYQSAIRESHLGYSRQYHADLLVEAEDSSGVSGAVAACVIFAMVARGQRVLCFVRDEKEAAEKRKELESRLDSMGFGVMYRIEELTDETVVGWCAPNRSSAVRDGLEPDVVLCTVENYEHVFHSSAMDADHLHSIQRSFEVVVVENLHELMDHDAFRLHLPFILDKHRLMLSTEGRSMQLLLTCNPLASASESDQHTPPGSGSLMDGLFETPKSSSNRVPVTIARRKIAERFFGGDSGIHAERTNRLDADSAQLSGHLVYLRRRRPPRNPASIRVKARKSVQLKDVKLALNKSIQGRICWIVLKGDVEALRSDILLQGKRRQHEFVSIAQLESRRSELQSFEWFVAYPEIETPQQFQMLRHFVGGIDAAKLVYFGEQHVDDFVRSKPKPTYPVFPSEQSPALFVSHLRSVASALLPDVPSRREEFARFGLSWDESQWSGVIGSAMSEEIPDNWHLETDGGLKEAVKEVDDQWPAVFVRHSPGLRRIEVKMDEPLKSSLVLRPRGAHYYPAILTTFVDDRGRKVSLVDPNRYATWFTARGLQLGKSDLGFFRPIFFDGQRQCFRIEDITQTADGVVIVAEIATRDGTDYMIPVRRSTFKISKSSRVEGPKVSRCPSAYLFEVKEAPRPNDPEGQAKGPIPSPCISEERIVALEQQSNATTRRPLPDIRFHMHVSISLLFIDGGHHAKINPEKLGEFLKERNWDSAGPEKPNDPAPWHDLSRVLAYALEKVAPAFLRFANAYAFSLPNQPNETSDEMPSARPQLFESAVILFVEPFSTKGTAIRAISTILDDESLRQAFIAALRKAAEDPQLYSEMGVRTNLEPEVQVPTEADRQRVRGVIDLLERKR